MTDLSYFTGRTFEDLTQGSEPWDWGIVLNGGGVIRNKDGQREAPDVAELTNLRGLTLLRTIFSELETRLQFGQGEEVKEEIVLTPALYTVADPVYAPEGEIYPQVAAPGSLPEDPSRERVATGPGEGGEEEDENSNEKE